MSTKYANDMGHLKIYLPLGQAHIFKQGPGQVENSTDILFLQYPPLLRWPIPVVLLMALGHPATTSNLSKALKYFLGSSLPSIT